MLGYFLSILEQAKAYEKGQPIQPSGKPVPITPVLTGSPLSGGLKSEAPFEYKFDGISLN